MLVRGLSRFSLGLTALLAAGTALATEYVWTGAAGDGTWATAGNWSVDGAVAKSCPNANTAVARFTNAANESVYLASSYALSKLSVECGTKTFTQKGNGCGLNIRDSVTTTGTLYVAENAVADLRCGIGVGTSGKTLMKTGPGLYKQSNSYFGYWNGTPGVVYLKEGKWSNSSALYLASGRIVIANGATMSTSNGGYSGSPWTVPSVHIEEGGVFEPTGTRVNFDGFTGTGTCSGSGSVSFLLNRGPYRFDGLIKTEFCPCWYTTSSYTEKQFLIAGQAKTLENAWKEQYGRIDRMRFASDAGGTFWLKGMDVRNWQANCPFVAEDEHSNGVTVVIGKLSYLGSSWSHNYNFSGKGTTLLNDVTLATAGCLTNVTGFIGAKSGGSITLSGNEGLKMGRAGVNVQGTVFFSAADLELKGALIGKGTAYLSANATFDEFDMRGGTLEMANGIVPTIAGGLGWLDRLQYNNSDQRNLTMRGGVLSGPFEVDSDLATLLPTKLPRPSAITNYNGQANCGGVNLYGGEIHLTQQSPSASIKRWTLDGGTAYLYSQMPTTPTVGFNGTRLALCPTNNSPAMAAFGSAISLAAGGVEVVNGLAAGAAARTTYLVGAATASGTETDGGVTRYGAGTFYFMKPATFNGPFRALDGVLLVPNNSYLSGKTDALYGSGALTLGNVKFTGDANLSRTAALNATTVTGGALVMPNDLSVSFASVAFAPGAALFVDGAKTVTYDTTPADAPIFTYTDGVLAKSAYATDDHLALNGGTLGDAAFAAHGIVAVGADATVTGTLTGADGVGFVGPADGVKRVLTLAGATSVAGGVTVNGVEVRPESASALGPGAVTVGAGEWMGGRLRFTQPLAFANAITAGGWGPADEQGALVFDASASVGSLTASRPLRLRVNSGATATVTGLLTADETVQVAGNNGTLYLASGKSGAGRLDVIKATLKVGGAKPSLGTGDIWLDDATLEFANTEPIVVSNRLYGVGRILLRGADVTFVSPSVDFAGKLEVRSAAKLSLPTQAQLSDDLEIVFSRLGTQGGRVGLGGVYRKIDRVVGYGTVEDASLDPKRVWKRSGLMVIAR